VHDSESIFEARTSRSIPRQTLGGLSLLLVVALTFGAARSGALVHTARDTGFQRVAAVLPKTVHETQRRSQRERPDARAISRASNRTCAGLGAPILPDFDAVESIEPLRCALIDLPPPALG